MPKYKPNKGLMKRVRITKSGRIKFRRAGGRHLRSHKSGKLLRGYRLPTYARGGDARRMAALLGIPHHRPKTDDAGTAAAKADTKAGTKAGESAK